MLSSPPMTKEFTTDSPTMEEILRKKQPVRKSVDIPIIPSVADDMARKEAEIETAESQLARERQKMVAGMGKSLAEGGKVADLVRKIETLEEELEDLWVQALEDGAIQTFWFQDIGKKRYDDLVTAHPPTPEQKKDWEKDGGEGVLAYNTETFPPALMALSAISPTMTNEQANKICDDWGTWEVIRLFQTCQAACAGVSTVPKSRRSLNDTDETASSN